ncbi:PREDICTED: serine/threonine-protein kinase HT1-like isoform X2 [Tarenaya hassleriana]|uniref:serine/threonine-protein kinase HT1-like isoform X2 n=1 Tax=Tarenaya hassleriana TaxID=28532 RepID=UPI0008FD9441|nr:PREDICTED: serine/threonine-protein kinase HT1-like isoform X2 [Tarenaya hassleriana]
MKDFRLFRQISNNVNERRLSLGEYKRAASWSKYLVSSGGEIKGEAEEEWSADMSQLLIGNKFATGRHSRIYRGIYKQRDVAIKLVSQPEENEELARLLEQQFTSEVALLFRLSHPNIITFVGACKKPPVFCIITEYLSGGSLRKYLHQQQPHSVPLALVLKLGLDIARGMQYLHSQVWEWQGFHWNLPVDGARDDQREAPHQKGRCLQFRYRAVGASDCFDSVREHDSRAGCFCRLPEECETETAINVPSCVKTSDN